MADNRRSRGQRTPEGSQLRVVVVSEIRLYREGLAQSLGNKAGVAVVGTAGPSDDALRLIRELNPQVALVDMARAHGLKLVRAIATLTPDVKVVALALPDGDSHVIAGAEAGISGYVPREASLEELVTTLQRVAAGEMPCSARVAAALANRLASVAAQLEAGSPTASLTSREREVLALVGDGLSNKEIGTRLCIEVATVKNHVHNILEKLRVGRRGQAAAVGRSQTLI